MALDIKLKGVVSGDCDTMVITDVTGDYNVTTNPGGYGAPNPAKTDFNGAQDYHTIIVVRSDETLTTFGPTYGNFSTSLLFSTGLNVTNLVDGHYILKYTLYDSATAVKYTKNIQYFVTCNMDCALQKELLKLAEDACYNSCDEKNVNSYMEYTMYKKALDYAVMCGDIKGAKKLYSLLAKKLNIDCGCNCK